MGGAKSKAGRTGARVLAAAAGLALALAAAEALVRATDPLGASYYRDVARYFTEAIALPPEAARPDGRVFENAPAVELELATFRYATDGAGLRAPRATAERPEPDPARRTLLFLGDSVTLGWGVDDEATWVRVLEREARAPGGGPLRCLNAGHLRYNTVQEADWLRAKGLALAPDAVVVTFVANDLEDHWAQYLEIAAALEAQSEATALERLGERARAWLRGLDGLRTHLRVTRELEREAQRAPERAEDVPDFAESWARTEAALDRLLSDCGELDVPLVVLDHAAPAVPHVRRWCEERGVPWHDFAFTPEERARDVRNSAADAHANELGNRLLAAKAHAGLAAAGVLAPPGRE